MKRMHRVVIVFTALVSSFSASSASAGCTKDTDCKGERICVKHECDAPAAVPQAATPRRTHQPYPQPADPAPAVQPTWPQPYPGAYAAPQYPAPQYPTQPYPPPQNPPAYAPAQDSPPPYGMQQTAPLPEAPVRYAQTYPSPGSSDRGPETFAAGSGGPEVREALQPNPDSSGPGASLVGSISLTGGTEVYAGSGGSEPAPTIGLHGEIGVGVKDMVAMVAITDFSVGAFSRATLVSVSPGFGVRFGSTVQITVAGGVNVDEFVTPFGTFGFVGGFGMVSGAVRLHSGLEPRVGLAVRFAGSPLVAFSAGIGWGR